MKKIPTLFQREFDHHRVVNINPVAPPELQWVLDGEGIATEKVDGACCAIINGTFYNRYDAKKDKRGRMKLPVVRRAEANGPSVVRRTDANELPVVRRTGTDEPPVVRK